MLLTNSQYNKILREYDNRRQKNQRLLKERTEQIHREIPIMKELENEIITNSMEYAKRAIFENKDFTSELTKKNNELINAKQELLTANGYPADYLDPIYLCPDCKDTGYINKEKCHCFKQAIVDLVYSQYTIKSVIKDENFHNFRYDYYSQNTFEGTSKTSPYENITNVVKYCNEFICNFDLTYQNLLIYGNTGVGKTYLCNCIAKELLDQSHTVIYLTAYQLFDILSKSTFKKKSADDTVDYDTYANYLLECDLLIIDDLGTEVNNTFVSSQLYNCINERHLKQKSTVISTNFTLDMLYNTYSERILSRITGNYKLLNIFGEDIRYKKTFL